MESQPDQLVPRKVPEFMNGNVKKVATGKHTTAIITSKGELWMTGRNSNGQLGDGTTTDSLVPKVVSFFQDRNLAVEEVAIGDRHTCAITNDGSLWAWGYCAKSRIPFKNHFFVDAGGLGARYDSDQLVPQLI
jgi:alpha-tubulin suppressor-like RCC1 family protein